MTNKLHAATLLLVLATLLVQLFILQTQRHRIEKLEDAVMLLGCITIKDHQL